jgi:ferredoxin
MHRDQEVTMTGEPRRATSAITVRYDQRRCAGYASCELIAPDAFRLDDAVGKAVLLVDLVGPERRAALEQAVRSCPTNAISLEFGDGRDG